MRERPFPTSRDLSSRDRDATVRRPARHESSAIGRDEARTPLRMAMAGDSRRGQRNPKKLRTAAITTMRPIM
jgi:hypothetical protein